jgi:hypothetical protein
MAYIFFSFETISYLFTFFHKLASVELEVIVRLDSAAEQTTMLVFFYLNAVQVS